MKSKECTKVLFSKMFFLALKIFCDISVGMELEKEKAESVNDNEKKANKTSLLYITGFLLRFSKIDKFEDNFFRQCPL